MTAKIDCIRFIALDFRLLSFALQNYNFIFKNANNFVKIAHIFVFFSYFM